jgi:DNA-binding transcriptional ArsR family regulator
MKQIDAAFFALSDPTRRAILARLASGEATVMELTAPFEISQPAISKHLKVLEDAGLIVRRVEGTTRPCRLRPDGLEPIDQWLAMMRKALDTNYARLDTLLARTQAASPGKRQSTRTKKRSTT